MAVIIATLANMEEAGFDGLEIQCSCGRVAMWPFGLLKRRIPPETEIRALVGRLSCRQCHRKVESVDQINPVTQGHGQPDVGEARRARVMDPDPEP
ncbi:hypothetical protein [Enterovirga sp. CN4-39]|uniref:hypothetical protein n=1 Tax=Enterovirga sp. CN4-39 TaxID=3400910 RepID=UPI003BFB503E